MVLGRGVWFFFLSRLGWVVSVDDVMNIDFSREHFGIDLVWLVCQSCRLFSCIFSIHSMPFFYFVEMVATEIVL